MAAAGAADPARADLPALGDEPAQRRDVLVVDLLDLVLAVRAGLAATPAGTALLVAPARRLACALLGHFSEFLREASLTVERAPPGARRGHCATFAPAIRASAADGRRFVAPRPRRAVKMAQAGTQAPTNERIVQPLEAVQAELAECRRREEQIARDLAQL